MYWNNIKLRKVKDEIVDLDISDCNIPSYFLVQPFYHGFIVSIRLVLLLWLFYIY